MFGRKREVLKQADGIPDYHLSPMYDGSGAGAFVCNPEFGIPVEFFRGRGRLAGTMSIFQSPQVYVSLFVPTSGLGGIQAGQFEFQGLRTSEELGI